MAHRAPGSRRETCGHRSDRDDGDRSRRQVSVVASIQGRRMPGRRRSENEGAHGRNRQGGAHRTRRRFAGAPLLEGREPRCRTDGAAERSRYLSARRRFDIEPDAAMDQGATMLTQIFEDQAAELHWLAYLFTGSHDEGIRAVTKALDSEDYGNPAMADFMMSWSRKLVIGASLETIRPQLQESAWRTRLAEDPDPGTVITLRP